MSKSGESTAVHLAPGVREMLVLDDEARIQSMQRDRWIDYARASAVLDRLSRLMATPERDRMPCLLLHGESNIGKTQIVRKFIRDHPPSFDERRGVEKRQVSACRCRRFRISSASTARSSLRSARPTTRRLAYPFWRV